MTDSRIPLLSGTTLTIKSQSTTTNTFYIGNEIGRGGSGIVYSGYYFDNLSMKREIRIKEFYPYKLNLQRFSDGSILVPVEKQRDFHTYREAFIRAYRINTSLYEHSSAHNYISNALDIYSDVINNTVYIISNCMNGSVLTYDSKRPLCDTIRLVKSIASAVLQIHDAGFLYLDLKPENIFTIPETNELVYLFDFDTLYPYRENLLGEVIGNYRISYTNGFAAYEQQRGISRQLGKHTDVYGIGAILYFLFYHRVPSAADRESDAVFEFPYSSSCLEINITDRFLPAMTGFFHHSLSSFYKDRYGDMNSVIDALTELQKLADPTLPFLKSSPIIPPHCFVGREKELDTLTSWYENLNYPCLFLTGMGGIGKSTLIRSFICSNREKFDTVLFLLFKNTIAETITDDANLQINTIERLPEESTQDYFKRKLFALAKLVNGNKVLLVLDNFEGPIDED